jgi:hypothetical protein
MFCVMIDSLLLFASSKNKKYGKGTLLNVKGTLHARKVISSYIIRNFYKNQFLIFIRFAPHSA